MDAEQIASFPPYLENVPVAAPLFGRPSQGAPPSSPRAITPASPRLELGSARTTMKKM